MTYRFTRLTPLFFLLCQGYATTLKDIRELKSAGLDDATIIAAIDSAVEISTQEIIELKKNGYSAELIQAILKSKKNFAVATAAPTVVAPSQNTLVITSTLAEKNTTVRCSVEGPRLYLEGKLIGVLKAGENKFDLPEGQKNMCMEYLNFRLESQITISKTNNFIQIYDVLEADDSSKLVKNEVLKNNHTAIAYYVESLRRRGDIVNDAGETVGQFTYVQHEWETGSRVKILDKVFYTVSSKAKYHTTMYYKDKNIEDTSEKATLFSTILFNENGQIQKVFSHHDLGKVLESEVDIQRKLELEKNKIELWNKQEQAKAQNNIVLVYSDKAKADSLGFELHIGTRARGKMVYALTPGEQKVCPGQYFYHWLRKNVSPSEKLEIPEGQKAIVAIHSNFIGNQSKIYLVPIEKDLTGINFENHKNFL